VIPRKREHNLRRLLSFHGIQPQQNIVCIFKGIQHVQPKILLYVKRYAIDSKPHKDKFLIVFNIKNLEIKKKEYIFALSMRNKQ